ncbi:amino acid adenylation domain-containing protein [Flavobacterium pectinovorum]|uniref:non-ribosomal peptide synthetase n=1 Tax=Flavobacterium pectinovorum TaxID=29533 RepID=UPI00265FDE9D|nr:non-ribosomal peptide synthetase [Flavobacterium pectinovorum]WKL50105.1 amino acid adenylation domain-containing protein [Flavobacterium pectinovorum]
MKKEKYKEIKILSIIYNANANGIWLWVEDDKLKFKSSQDINISEILIELKENKNEIIDILQKNNICNERIVENIIYRSGNDESILSFSQERLWFIEQYEQGTNAYHMPRVLELDPAADIAGIKYALEGIVWRHEILRSTIEQRADLDHGIQVVHYKALFIEEIRLGAEEDYEIVIKSDINRPFDLSLEYPIRAKFYILESESGGQRRFLLINMHHIASDGWSMDIFQRELLSYYKGYIDGDKTFALPALDIQYKDFAVWQRNYLTGEVLANQLGYWKSKLSGYVPLEFPADHIRPSQIDYRGSHQNFVLSKEVSEQLRLLAQKLGVTLHSVMLSSVNILLGKYTGQDDIVIGTPIANRHHRQTQDLIGFFVNTQVNRTILSKGQSYVSLIDQVHQDQIEGQLHQDLPFEKLVEELGVDRDASRHPIFQVMFVVESSKIDKVSPAEEIDYLKPVYFEGSYEVEKFDLSIFIDDAQESLVGSVGYAVSLFDKDTIERFIGHYEHLLAELVKAPEQCYDQISLLLPSEYKEMVYDWNATDKDYPVDKTIYELFQAQAESTPDSVALVYEGQELSYRELNERSNQLARHIRCEYQKRTREELKADSLIGLCLDRSLEMVIGILAVLKSGGAYVPIDPEYPQDRIDYILEDTGAVLVLSQKHLLNKEDLQLPKDKVITIDLGGSIYDGQDISNLPQHSGAKNLAYVIYTSGTTGRPKGVMIEHAGVINTLDALYDIYDSRVIKKSTTYTAYVFDVFVSEVFASIVQGLELHILSKTIRMDSVLLSDYFVANKINLVYLPPIVLSSLPQRIYPDLQILIYAGEPCDKKTASLYSEKIRLFNFYGPTEACIYATSKEIVLDEVEQIGRAISNTKAYVLDTNHQPVPVGVIGELYIGGAGLARGYLNREDLTAERFMGNPFASASDKSKGYDRLYKTGDLVRWLSDGNLEYIARNDDQVKIRGYRIELGEIEHALSSIAGITQSSVMVRERETSGGIIKSLVGYYVAEESASDLDQGMILEKLSAVLPEYMIPGALVGMESFPLTINGKLDKRSLPDPDFSVAAEDYQAPGTAMEVLVCGIWQEVLGLARVGVRDNFFRIGGDSILSIQVSSRIRQAGFGCQVKDIFECKSVEKLCKYLEEKNTEIMIDSEQGNLTGSFELLPVQQWFIDQADSGKLAAPNHWNQSFLIKTDTLDLSKLKSIIGELVSYHDILRVGFIKEADGSFKRSQLYRSEIELPELKTLDISHYSQQEIHEYLTDWQRGFDLEHGPLFSVGYLYGYKDESARLYFALHHMLVDGVSWRILADDMRTLYSGKSLPQKGSSYRQWVDSVRNYSKDHPSELSYWEEQLAGMPKYESPDQDQQSYALFLELDKPLTQSLLHTASKAYHTEINDLLLTALAYALKGINQSDVQGITLEGHGRENIDPSIDHSHTVGWFTSMFPVRLEVKESIKESIQFIKESLRNIPNKGVGFGSFATDESVSCGHDDLPGISFNYLGQFDVREGEDNWQVVFEGSGASIDPSNRDHNQISINGSVNKNKLGFSVVSRLGEEKTKELAAGFKHHLEKVIEHCADRVSRSETSYTPSDFNSVRISQSLLDSLEYSARESQNELKYIYPATSLQQGFIYHALSQPDDDVYRVQQLDDYHEPLDVDKYLQAWNNCILEYPILRTAFNWEEDIIQIIYKTGNLEHSMVDISDLATQQERDAAIELIQTEDRKRGFDLSSPTLLRLCIIKQSEDCYTILRNTHHSIIDGWSGPILMTSLHGYYQLLIDNQKVNIKEDTAYLSAQEYIYRHKKDIQSYWDKSLTGIEGANDINALLNNPIDFSSYKQVEQASTNILEISGPLYGELKGFTQREGITINAVVQFVWHKLLQVYSGNKQSIVGTTISGRDLPIEDIENSVGLYINTLPLIIDWDNNNTILSQLHEIQQRVTQMNTHSFVDLAKLQINGERIFHNLFVFENYPAPKGSGKKTLKVNMRNFKDGVDYPLSIMAYEYGDRLVIKLGYDRKYLSEDKAQGHLVTLEYIIGQIIGNPNKLHNEISLLLPSEHQEMVYDWNATDKDYPVDKTIYELFQAQAESTPDSVALVYDGQELSYRELNERSNQLARHIRCEYQKRTQEALRADSLIALCLDRGLEMIIGILAVVKSGGAYVPIDPEYPQERIDYILEDTGAVLVLSQKHLLDKEDLQLPKDKVITIDLSGSIYDGQDSSNLPQHSGAKNLAYVIYTSGTTGRPKGVMIEHAGVVNLVYIQKGDLEINTQSRILQYASTVFDASLWEIFSSLSFGASLYILSSTLRQDVQLLGGYIEDNKINVATIPPALLRTMFYKEFSNLKTLVVAGESTSLEMMQKWSKGRRLINAYGPTENTVCVTMHLYEDGDLNTNIGKPLSNMSTYVLDQNHQPVPIGVIGELHIGGAGLARGYLNRDDLTSERFITNPFATDTDLLKGYDRLYKTGDLVRWLPDGNLEYIGRNDDQVKIRGYRIELGEIEHALSSISGIRQSCVLVKERETSSGVVKSLVGYYVADGGDSDLDQAVILEELSKMLPEYMVPGALVGMDSFPLTINGKLDKRSLPDPDFTAAAGDYMAPSTATEILVCGIWQDVLGLKQVSITDNFFRIGGDSILSIQVSSRIRQAGFVCQVKDIFECKSVEKLSRYLEDKNAEIAIESEQGDLVGEFGLLPIQQWFTEQSDFGYLMAPNHWNQSFLIKVESLDLVKLESVIAELVSYHDILRVGFIKESDGRFKRSQFYRPEIKLPGLKTLDISKYSEKEVQDHLTQWQSGFDLEHGPLFSVGYLYGYEDGSARIYFALHHMLVDGVSWRILADDIRTLYSGKRLPQKGSSYRQWVESVKNYAKDHPSESLYWEEQLAGMPEYESADVADQIYGDFLVLDKTLTQSLLYTASKAYHTEINDLLLTALAYALKEIKQSDVQGITLEGHGRENIDPYIDHSHTVGWFTSMFPVRLEVKESIKESIQFIKESLRNIPNKGVGFGSFATDESVSYGHDDLPGISFNYLGQFDVREGDNWQVVSEGSGASIDPSNRDHNRISINGSVNKNELGFSVISRLGEEKTKELTESFKRHLTKVIDHCSEQVAKSEISYTPSDFNSVRISQSLLDRLELSAREGHNEVKYIYPATSLQQGFIYHALSQPDDDAYRVQQLDDYHEPLDVDKYLQAWKNCILQYPILRTAFNWEEDIIQIIYKEGNLEHTFVDISSLVTQEEKDAAIALLQTQDRKRGFDFGSPTLLRLCIIKQSEDYYTVLRNTHHSIADGWSGPVLLASLHGYYQLLIDNQPVSIKEDTAYVSAQEYIYRHKRDIQSYWDKTFTNVEGANNINPLLDDPIDFSSYKQVDQASTTMLEISGTLYSELKSFTQREGITINVVVQFVWHKLLQVYSGNKQSIVGTTISGRDLPIEDIENSVGLYINTLPLIIDWDNNDTILSQLHEIQQRVTQLNTHSFADLAKLQINGERIFHSLFVFENYPVSRGSGKKALKISRRKSIEKADYPLSIMAYEYGERLIIKLDYDGQYLKEENAQGHLVTLEHIISQVVGNSNKSHDQIGLVLPTEYEQIVYDWNATDKDYPVDKTIYELFQAQAEKTPENIALVYDGQELSYRELNERSNQLARHIRCEYQKRTQEALRADSLIALCLDRGLEMIIGILAVVKSGGAYVPIDPEYPQERIDYILEDTGAVLVLSQKHLLDKEDLQLPKDKVITIDLSGSIYDGQDSSNLPQHSSAKNLAYVIYTSGTTGRPKGVMIEHAGVVNTLDALYDIYDNRVIKKSTTYTAYVFDVFVSEVFASILQGLELHILSKTIRIDSVLLSDYFIANKINLVYLPPIVLSSLPQRIYPDLQILIYAGEPCDKKTASLYSEKIKLFNFYGPTEACIYSTCKQIVLDEVEQIGRAISNTRAYVLDQNRQPVPIGVIGELHIGGAGLARGYLNRDDLTSERFITNPFATDTDLLKGYDRLYKTGDLVRWLADGNLEYIGRNDDQVKIRGYRIELGEIEHALSSISGIRQSCVLVKERETSSGVVKSLVGYYVADGGDSDLDQAVILEELSKMLPEYMVPGALVGMDSFPLTINGKLDKRSLPDPDFTAAAGDYMAPSTATEILVCGIWQDVLGLKQVSITDNFFRIGGDSILSIQVSSRIRQAGFVCQVKDIFECKSVEKLSRYLEDKNAEIAIESEQGDLVGEFGLLPIQQWFTEQSDFGYLMAPNHWNQSFLIKVESLDLVKLESVIAELVSYHDILRVGFIKESDGRFKRSQFYRPEIKLPGLKTLDISKYSEKEVQDHLTQWQSGFDLEHGPLFSVGYLYGYKDGSARIYFSLHHMIVDGVSWRILADDIRTLYSGKRLPQKGSSYRQWVESVKNYAKDHPSESLYWEEQLAGMPEYESADGADQIYGDFLVLDKTLTQSLLYTASKAYHTEINDLLLTALAYALKEIKQSDVQGITLEGHGRENIDPYIDHSHTVGWFTSMFPVRLEVKESIKESIQFIKESLRNIPNKGVGFGSFATDESVSYGHDDLPGISFNYLGQFDVREGDNWQVVSEGSGASIDPSNRDHNRISINGSVNKNELGFSVISRLGEEKTKELTESFKRHLTKVIDHCSEQVAKSEISYTPSDFNSVRISQSLLDRLQSKVKL